MGLLRASGGSVRIRGEEITWLSPARIAQAGVGYVPQGRRLWRLLSVAEHLSPPPVRGAAPGPSIASTTFLVLPNARTMAAASSRRRQQMLAISARLTNPQLLIMDEPTEGLAPVIVAQVEEMLGASAKTATCRCS
jgi:ABC-type branched-subunit amino acid transport system ATPase component